MRTAFCLPLLLVMGCDSSTPPPVTPAPQPAPAQPAASDWQPPASLPTLGEALPVPLDDGRLEIAPPKDWVVPPRGEWLVRFAYREGRALPSIIVHGADSAPIADVTQANVEEFARTIQEELKNEIDTGNVPVVKTIAAGNFVGVYYTRQAKMGGQQLDRLFLVTASGGRRYTIELRVLFGTLAEFRNDALAVAAGMKFLMPSSN